MGSGNFLGGSNESDGYGFQHELDDYINSFAEEDQFSLFFDDTYYGGFGGNDVSHPFLPDECAQPPFDVPDSAIDPRLRAKPSIPAEDPQTLLPHPSASVVAPPQPLRSYPSQGNVNLLSQTPTFSSPSRKLRRRSKKDESTHNNSPEAKYPLYDRRLYELATHHYTPLRGHCVVYKPVPDVGSLNDGPTPPEISQSEIDEFLASLDSMSFDSIGDIVMTDPSGPAAQPVIQPTPTHQSVSIHNKQEYVRHMLAPSAPLIQPSEKRKRGRPKKDEVDESHQEATSPIELNLSYYQGINQPFMQSTSVPGPSNVLRPPISAPQYIPPAYGITSLPTPSSSRSTPNPGSETGDENSRSHSKRRRLDTRGQNRSMSKKEQAYLEMDDKVKLYDQTNVHELLYYPSIKPGRTPCFWIQRHPYANTRVYEDHYRTWCRYRHCKGVETTELIRTASGEMREKNYKHPRTIIAGNYQVAVDWEYATDEISAFKNDPEGQHAYDRRNVFDTLECFFHLRCFEQLVDFPHVVRTQLVQIDHRVLHQDKSRNKITKRKNKGGTNAAEIEWYLKDDAEQWMKRTQLDWTFNPLPGSDESLERVLLNGKKQYNERKGSKYMLQPGSEFGSPAPSEL
ncbi:hypothetical protein AOL_s00097g350 [Orbilia oligospora ATCC 24927]|uniref:Uncharacterized protein n=1 Tax=Arthrobotrys oligospora (strain ATCC 24927 / CBS 115.81 / DSM 1491) TaxID=756982 RepID=G1XJ23_ARTOA|nr:hypothetical protein AOL_s00097g350 [Orbilia oligospora ATCC 24927]EGX46924.1 hypothetical protein AOL_s00097g350 [Orbilia oligospora ATCC 24927]